MLTLVASVLALLSCDTCARTRLQAQAMQCLFIRFSDECRLARDLLAAAAECLREEEEVRRRRGREACHVGWSAGVDGYDDRVRLETAQVGSWILLCVCGEAARLPLPSLPNPTVPSPVLHPPRATPPPWLTLCAAVPRQRRRLPRALRWWTTLSSGRERAHPLDAAEQAAARVRPGPGAELEGSPDEQEGGAGNVWGGVGSARESDGMERDTEQQAQEPQSSSSSPAASHPTMCASRPMLSPSQSHGDFPPAAGGVRDGMTEVEKVEVKEMAADDQGGRAELEVGWGRSGVAEEPSEAARVLLQRKGQGENWGKAGRAPIAGGRSRKVTALLVPHAEDPEHFVLELRESASSFNNTPLLSPQSQSSISSPLCATMRHPPQAREDPADVGTAWDGESVEVEEPGQDASEDRREGWGEGGGDAEGGEILAEKSEDADGLHAEEALRVGAWAGDGGHASLSLSGGLKLREAVARDWCAIEAKLLEGQIAIGALEDEVRRREEEVDRAVAAQGRMRACCAWAVMLVGGCRSLVAEVLQYQAELEGRLAANSDARDEVAYLRHSYGQALEDLQIRVAHEAAARGELQYIVEEERRRWCESCRAEGMIVDRVYALVAAVEDSNVRLQRTCNNALLHAAEVRQREREEERDRREEERGKRRQKEREGRVVESELRQDMRHRVSALVAHFARYRLRCACARTEAHHSPFLLCRVVPPRCKTP